MITRRLASAFIIALLVAGAFTFWLSQKVSKTHAPVAPKNRYVAAVANIEAGQAIHPENLKLIDWPAEVQLVGAFNTIDSLNGRVLLYPISAGEPILDRQLASPGSGSGLTAKIPEGMRAISLRSDEVVGVAGFLLPGTHVDVLVTLHTASSPEPVTATVLQDVEILATGQKTQPDPEGKASTATVVTLLVKPDDAEKVVLASTQGTLHFVLRNGSDRLATDGHPALMSQLAGVVAPAPVAHTGNAQPKRLVVVEPKVYAVETVMGAKNRTDNF